MPIWASLTPKGSGLSELHVWEALDVASKSNTLTLKCMLQEVTDAKDAHLFLMLHRSQSIAAALQARVDELEEQRKGSVQLIGLLQTQVIDLTAANERSRDDDMARTALLVETKKRHFSRCTNIVPPSAAPIPEARGASVTTSKQKSSSAGSRPRKKIEDTSDDDDDDDDDDYGANEVMEDDDGDNNDSSGNSDSHTEDDESRADESDDEGRHASRKRTKKSFLSAGPTLEIDASVLSQHFDPSQRAKSAALDPIPALPAAVVMSIHSQSQSRGRPAVQPAPATQSRGKGRLQQLLQSDSDESDSNADPLGFMS